MCRILLVCMWDFDVIFWFVVLFVVIFYLFVVEFGFCDVLGNLYEVLCFCGCFGLWIVFVILEYIYDYLFLYSL